MPLAPTGHAPPISVSGTGGAATNVVASSTLHAKGSWTTILASTPWEVGSINVANGNVDTTGVNTSTAFDVGIAVVGAAAGTETVIATGIIIGGTQAGMQRDLPLQVPAGYRISLRSQSAVVSKSVNGFVSIRRAGQFVDLPARCITYGFDAATSAGVTPAVNGTAAVKGAWTQIVASTTTAGRWWLPCLAIPPTATVVACDASVDYGFGAVGSEQIFIADVQATLTTAELIRTAPPLVRADVPSGIRLAVRSRTSVITAGSQPSHVLLAFD